MTHDLGVDPSLLVALDFLLSERNVTRAAARAGVTQPAMSRALARLRDHFRDPLLVRSGRAMVLTPRAEAMRGPFHGALEALARALADGAPFDPAASSRRFRIATVDYAVVALVLPMLERVRAGGARVELVVSPLLPGFEDDLASGHLDLAILPRRRSSRALVWRKLRHDPFISVVKRGHSRVRGRPTLAEFAALSHVVVVPEASTRNALDERLKAIGLSRHVALRVPSFLPALAAVASSELVLTAPQSLVRAFAEPFALSVFAPPLALGGITLSAAWHERQRTDPGHAWLRTQLVRTASLQP